MAQSKQAIADRTMQSDYAWVKAMHTTPLVKAEPARQSADVPLIGPGAHAWGDGEAVNKSPAQSDQHGSESESFTATGATAAFADTDAPEVDSAAATRVAASPLSPAAWPFVQREHADTPVLHPVPRCAKVLEAAQIPLSAMELRAFSCSVRDLLPVRGVLKLPDMTIRSADVCAV